MKSACDLHLTWVTKITGEMVHHPALRSPPRRRCQSPADIAYVSGHLVADWLVFAPKSHTTPRPNTIIVLRAVVAGCNVSKLGCQPGQIAGSTAHPLMACRAEKFATVREIPPMSCGILGTYLRSLNPDH